MADGYYPLAQESVDNATAVEYTLGEVRSNRLLCAIEITTGTATAGTVAVAVIPFGCTEYQTLSTTFDCTAPVPGVIEGHFAKIKFTPSSLDSGAKFTPTVDSLSA